MRVWRLWDEARPDKLAEAEADAAAFVAARTHEIGEIAARLRDHLQRRRGARPGSAASSALFGGCPSVGALGETLRLGEVVGVVLVCAALITAAGAHECWNSLRHC